MKNFLLLLLVLIFILSCNQNSNQGKDVKILDTNQTLNGDVGKVNPDSAENTYNEIKTNGNNEIKDNCVPSCTDKQCGDDGCGGICGTCSGKYKCVNFKCVCTPQCEGKQCGDDGCGGVCGSCAENQECLNGLCKTKNNYQQCEKNGFVSVKDQMIIDKTYAPENYLEYVGVSSETLPQDAIIVQIFQGDKYKGPDKPGVYDLEGTNYADCGLCILAYSNCTADTGCEKVFFQKQGTVKIDSIGDAGDTFNANLSVVLEEVKIDPNTYKSTPVPNGEKWCINNYKISKVIKENKPEDHCVKEGTGVLVNNNIADFTLTNCYGEKFSLHSLCGKSKAVWIVAVAGWCPACSEYVPKAYNYYKNYENKGLELLVVLGEDAYQQKPTLAYCENYAKSHNVDPARVYIDFQWQTLFSNIYPYVTDSILLPWQALLDGDNMGYVWHSPANGGDLDINLLMQLLND